MASNFAGWISASRRPAQRLARWTYPSRSRRCMARREGWKPWTSKLGCPWSRAPAIPSRISRQRNRWRCAARPDGRRSTGTRRGVGQVTAASCSRRSSELSPPSDSVMATSSAQLHSPTKPSPASWTVMFYCDLVGSTAMSARPCVPRTCGRSSGPLSKCCASSIAANGGIVAPNTWATACSHVRLSAGDGGPRRARGSRRTSR